MDGFDLSLCQLFESAVIADPYPFYARLHREDPVHWDPFLHAWAITSYLDVHTVQQKFSSVTIPEPEQLEALRCGALSPIARVLRRQVIFMDGASHARLRTTVGRALTPKYLDTLRHWVDRRARELADGLSDRGAMDVMADFADPLTTGVTAQMLGIPEGERPPLKRWSLDLAETLTNFQLSPDSSERVSRTIDEASEYLRGVIRGLERQPRECVTYALMAGELSEDEVIANCLFLLPASQETSAYLIGNAMVSFLRNPAELDRVRVNPALLASAVEETLRYESPSQYAVRLAPCDLTLGGKELKRGQTVISMLGAANRDPERFADAQRFDVARTDNRHLAFGWGPHFCLGAALSRIEAPIALGALLPALGEFEFDPQAKLAWQTNPGLRGPASLPIRFGKSAQVAQFSAARRIPSCPFVRQEVSVDVAS